MAKDQGDGQMWTVEELVANLRDVSDDAGSRALFARALGERGAEAAAAIPALIDVLSEEHPSLQMEAADALGKMGAAALTAVPSLQRLKENAPSPGVREAANDAIIALTDPAEYQRLQGRRRKSGVITLFVCTVILVLVAGGIWLMARRYL
jgi:HEAT repeat protein